MALTPGTYNAAVTRIYFREADSGAIMAYFTCQEATTGELVSGALCLILKDAETVSEKTHRTLKSVFPKWDGINPLDLESPELHEGAACEIVCDFETYKDKTTLKIKYLNSLDGGDGPGKKIDRNAFIAKYGSRLRALNGGTSAPAPRRPATAAAPAPAPATPPPPPAPRSAPPSPPRNKVAPSSMEEVWGIITKAMDGQPDDVVAAEYYRVLEKVAPGKPAEKFTPEDWGRARIEADNLQF